MKGTPTGHDLNTTLVEQILELEGQAAQLDIELGNYQRRAEAWKQSRWHRTSAYLSSRPRRSLADRARTSVGAARALFSANRKETTPDDRPRQAGRPAPPAAGSSALSEPAIAERAANLRPAVAAGRKLRVAAVMDAFTRAAFAPECDIVDLHPDTWRTELESADADLLFIESAWRGHRDSWHDTVQHKPQELVDIVDWCHNHGIASVFWNKEDPVYYGRYSKVAALFDHVFTTDLETIPRYIEELGHQRVHVLPFAAQPRMCNPIEAHERRAAAVFAGSHYPGFKQRNKDLFAQFDGVGRVLPIEIYDRYLHSDNPWFRWPEPYGDLVVGTLPPDQIDVAYKGYRIALNVNTVTTSQTMLARRAFDLLASGTPTISNFAHSIKVLFGDLILASNDSDRLTALAQQIIDDPDTTDKRRVMGVRHILRHHTYADRWRHVVATVSGVPQPKRLQRVGLVCHAESAADVRRWADFAAAESQVTPRLVVISAGADAASECAARGIATLTPSAAETVAVADVLGDVDAIAVLSPVDWYGPYYLEGLIGALAYSSAGAVAKTTRFRLGDAAGTALVDEGHEYRWWEGAPVRWTRAVVRAEHVQHRAMSEFTSTGSVPAELDVLGVDRFDYLEGQAAPTSVRTDLSADLPIHSGAPFDAIVQASQRVRMGISVPMEDFPADAQPTSAGKRVIVRATGEGVVIAWPAHGDTPAYVRFRQRYPVAKLAADNVLQLRMQASGEGYLGVNVSWYDAHGQRTPGYTYLPGPVHEIEVPTSAEELELSLTLRGSGAQLVRSITLSPHDLQPPQIVTGWVPRTLVLVDGYPAYGDYYRNGFVHARVRGYRELGHDVIVFVMKSAAELSYREYQGVTVITGTPEMLHRLIETDHFDHVLAHFISAPSWSILKDFRGRVPITIFAHGSDIQPYWRREFNYRTATQREHAIQLSEKRMRLWRDIAQSSSADVNYVFVSQTFRDQVAEDFATLGFQLPSGAASVISNPIDTELFSYEEKDPELRKRILLLRPFASQVYANDLAIAAILELADEPWFSELDFLIVGDGVLFEELTSPVRDMPNVRIERRFLPQDEIAELHKEYGVFLVPTRQDTQGVSRGEAMSSGLVPVTTDIPVIREFLNTDEGYLAPYDDSTGLADAIRDMYYSPDIFSEKSRRSAARIRQTIATQIVLPQEIKLFATTPATSPGGDHR